jgi:sugar phosphate isomerase/epimerase
MEIGIFAKTFSYKTLDEVLDAVIGHGLHTVQFNLACVGLPTVPDQIDPALPGQIRAAMEARRITMAAVSGTFNMIDPDLQKRRDGLRRLRVLASACKPMGTSVITLCTGSRDPRNMWQWHPENATPEAWRDLIESMNEALEIAETYDLVLGIEPEGANVIYSAKQSRRLLDELQSPHVKIIMDGANLFHSGDFSHMHDVLDEAFDLLGDDVVLAHAKDLAVSASGSGIEWCAAGQGSLDYDHYLALLHAGSYNGPLILHGLHENQVDGCVAFLRRKLALMDAHERRS